MALIRKFGATRGRFHILRVRVIMQNIEHGTTAAAVGVWRLAAASKRAFRPLVAAGAIAVAIAIAAAAWPAAETAKRYATAEAARGTVDVTVSATGTVKPVATVQVGSQASGTIAWIGVDFNSPVKRGQVIARLDPATVKTQVDNARASVANAEAARVASTSEIEAQEASVASARANVAAARAASDDARAQADRYAGLENVLAARDIEAARSAAAQAAAKLQQAEAQLRQAEAALGTVRARRSQSDASIAQASAQLDQASANLDNTIITSPIDGVVVSRDVELGQTVAASLQAPTLFTIANDLAKMQVLAAIDEADVGQVREGQTVVATVDAFPTESFLGRVAQVRLNPVTTDNVVTYTAVVDVENPELKLRPGMTANVVVSVDRREDVLTVPNAALRFRPELSEEEQTKQREASAARRGARGDGDRGGDRGGDRAPSADRQTVWVLGADGAVAPRRVRTGLTDGRVTEILESDLAEGDSVITGSLQASEARQQSTRSGSPLGGRPPVGGSRSRGR
jgi:HlyD family secretion protein